MQSMQSMHCEQVINADVYMSAPHPRSYTGSIGEIQILQKLHLQKVHEIHKYIRDHIHYPFHSSL